MICCDVPANASFVNCQGIRGANNTVFDLTPTNFHLNIASFSANNDTGTLDLFADRSGNHLSNFRGTFRGSSQPNIPGGLGTYSYGETAFSVTQFAGVLPVPEPSALLLGSALAVGMGFCQRRRWQQTRNDTP